MPTTTSKLLKGGRFRVTGTDLGRLGGRSPCEAQVIQYTLFNNSTNKQFSLNQSISSFLMLGW